MILRCPSIQLSSKIANGKAYFSNLTYLPCIEQCLSTEWVEEKIFLKKWLSVYLVFLLHLIETCLISKPLRLGLKLKAEAVEVSEVQMDRLRSTRDCFHLGLNQSRRQAFSHPTLSSMRNLKSRENVWHFAFAIKDSF